MPTEPITEDAKKNTWCVQYGVDHFDKLFTSRQLLTLGTLVRPVRKVALDDSIPLPPEWREAIAAFLTVLFDKTADYNSAVCTWHVSGEKMRNTFARFAIPIAWDIAESATINDVGGSVVAQLEWIARYIETALDSTKSSPAPTVVQQSATQAQYGQAI